MPTSWREGHAILRERLRALPARLAADVRVRGPVPGAARRFLATGTGSSAAHARFLAQLLAEHVGVPARFEPLGAFLDSPPPDAADTALVVFSQGLSPNARLALAAVRAWAGVVLVTAVRDDEGERGAALATARAAGVSVWELPAGAGEFGTLLRVAGPMAGYLAALRLAEAVAAARGTVPAALRADATLVAARVAAAPERIATLVPPALPDWRTAPPRFVVTGSYGALVHNLPLKVLEGLLLPLPPLGDVLEMAHGPLQEAYAGRATFVALTRPDAPREEALVARLAASLAPERHVLLRLAATLPAPLAVFEHEALVNEIVLGQIEARGIDQVRWPGRGREAALYDVGAAGASGPAPHDRTDAASGSAGAGAARRPRAALEALAWPVLAGALAAGATTLVVPLGATEQHGPHLPFATDSWIAGALGERFCARVPEAVLGPTIPLGCSSEHMAFPGTLDLRAETLRAVLADVAASAGRHGFRRLFVFSAHGGNGAALRALAPALRAASPGLDVVVFGDLGAVTAALHAAAATCGIAPAAAGHHAGEVETSIVAALRPGVVDATVLAPGRTDVPDDPQTLFYPSLRTHAPSGVVGDPTHASAARGERYLAAWVDVLVAAYQGEKNSR